MPPWRNLIAPYRDQEIAHLFSLAAEVDREIHQVNASAPDGVHQRLRHVENEAHNLEFSRDNPSLAKTVELRNWDNSCRMLWPQRHFGSLAAAFAQSMIVPATGDRWSEPEIQAERRREHRTRAGAACRLLPAEDRTAGGADQPRIERADRCPDRTCRLESFPRGDLHLLFFASELAHSTSGQQNDLAGSAACGAKLPLLDSVRSIWL